MLQSDKAKRLFLQSETPKDFGDGFYLGGAGRQH